MPAGFSPAAIPVWSCDYLWLYRLSRDRTSGAAVLGHWRRLSVPPFRGAPNIPQAGAAKQIDPGVLWVVHDPVAAFDPRFGKMAIWAQHTVAGGAGSEIDWYEINPS